MEAYYYSSDEEMAWGPRTLREIKGLAHRRGLAFVELGSQKKEPFINIVCRCPLGPVPLEQPPPVTTNANVNGEFINRGSNIKTQTGTKIKEDSKMGSNPSSKIDSVCDNIDNLNISKTSTTYFTPNHTPNESLHTNPNSNFLEKLSHAIDNPSELSEYASVLSDSGNDKLEGTSEAEDISDKIKVLNIPKILITEADCLGNNDSCINFIRSLENRETCYNIDNFQQTLVENTYALSDDSVEESVIINEQDCEVTENSFSEEQKFTEQAEEEDVIVISDEDSDEDYSFSCTTDVDNDNVIAVKKETTFTECKHKESTSNIIDSKISKQSEVELHEDQFKHDKCNGTGNTSLESNSVSRDSDEKSPETSPLTPNIEHKHFTTQDYLRPNYTMSDDEVVDSTPVRTELGADPQTPSDTYITPGTLKSVKQQLFPTDSKKDEKSYTYKEC
ncbi:hypothetical protein NQ315_005660 [Exocentrus adspersus]|uniref:Uncharacterized protein n=1 Tax=Exocentrus adspersus TaxID=1586481 RepID=A0AAV8V6L4_9CUCU|nr:hypothetical protein NQ315_005660 [Exocentrus adspersus]